MKIKKSATITGQTRAPVRVRSGVSYAEVTEQFLSAKPIDLSTLGVVAPKTCRPLVSVTAKQHDIEYVSFALPGNEDFVVFIPIKLAKDPTKKNTPLQGRSARPE